MYPVVLEETSSSLIVALSDTEVGKVLLPPKYVWVDAETQEPINFPDSNWSPSHQKECDYLQFVNKINDAFPKFLRSDFWEMPEGERFDMLVMERLYPLPYNYFGIAERRKMYAELKRKLLELHDFNFIHGDIMRPTNYYTRGNYEWMFGNIVQTENGLRLTDLGFSMRYGDAEHKRSYIARMLEEKNEIEYFKNYYFSLKKRRK
jgi:hypothetical protein